MTTTVSTSAGSGSGGTERVFGGAIVRLNPRDGLFLRAEHLDAMQRYARSLATAVGRGGGPGVVYGYTVTLGNSGTTLELTDGLAMDAAGQPLLLDAPVSVSLAARAALTSGLSGGAGFWVVEILAGSAPIGDTEQVFGLICDDPCGNGQQFSAYIADGVRIRVRRDSLALSSHAANQLRSTLVSAYFERERGSGGTLLPTSQCEDPGNPGAQLGSPVWAGGSGPPTGEAVPLALLLRDGSSWVLDTWAARRDRIETPPLRAWTQRTGRRPVDVFHAQVLQFQAHLGALSLPAIGVTASGGALAQAGIVELPPAGYLPVDPDSQLSVNDQVLRLLGPGVDVRFCSARPDETGLSLEQAQHLDRISLTSGLSAPDRKPKVDVVVPDGEPTIRSRTSSIRFANGTADVKFGRTEHSYTGLARLAHGVGRRLTLAFAAAAETKFSNDPVAGLWFALETGHSPFDLRQTEGTLLQAVLATHQPRNNLDKANGQAYQEFRLDGRLTCQEFTLDPVSGLPSFTGTFRGRGSARWGKKTSGDGAVMRMRLVVTEAASFSGYVLSIQTSGDLTFDLEIEVRLDASGQWSVTAVKQLGDPNAGGGETTAQLDQLPAADVPFSSAWLGAERGLATLSATTFPQDAVNLLFGDASAGATEPAFQSPHGWVLFTRRHLRDCAPTPQTDEHIRLDLYVEEQTNVSGGSATSPPSPAPTSAPVPSSTPAPSSVAAAVLTVAPTRHYLGLLTWDGETYMLAVDSGVRLSAWQREHTKLVPIAADIWLGSILAPTQTLVDQVASRLGASGSLQVVEKGGDPPLATTPRSHGALVVAAVRST